MTDPVIRRYLKDVSGNLVGPGSRKRATLKALRDAAEEWAAEHPDHTGEDLRREFGDPEQFASAGIASLTPREAAALLQRKKTFRRWLLAITILIIIALAGAVIFIIKWNESTAPTVTYYAPPVYSALSAEQAANLGF